MKSIEKSWISNKLSISEQLLNFENLHCTPLGKVTKVLAREQTLYFKTDELIGSEVIKTEHIAHRLGADTISIAGSSIDRNWLLTHSAGIEVFNSSNKKHWLKAMTLMAQLHQLKLDEIDMENLSVNNFKAHEFGDFVSSQTFMDYWDISTIEKKSLKEVSNYINQLPNISVLETSKPSICHGDSHARNVLVDNDHEVRWFDWKEAHVGNPLCDLGFFLWWLTPDRKQLGIQIDVTNDFIEKLSLTYQLKMYGELKFKSIKDLMIIGLAHRAMLYHGTYFNLLESKPFYVTYALRQLVKIHATAI